MNEITYQPIGVIHSPFKEPKGTPIQPASAEGVEGEVELLDEYIDGLKDLDGFSKVILIYHFHLSREPKMSIVPFMDDVEHGLFATRAPARPNPIGISVVDLLAVEENILRVRNLDIVDNTPLLDIKPYTSKFDVFKVERNGWLEKNVRKLPETRDDGRFSRG